jgi:hypothetical protein
MTCPPATPVEKLPENVHPGNCKDYTSGGKIKEVDRFHSDATLIVNCGRSMGWQKTKPNQRK